MLRVLTLIGAVVLVLAGCGKSGQQPEPKKRSASVDTAAVRSALDSLHSVVETAAKDGDIGTIRGLLAPDARVSLPGRPPAQGRDSIAALLRSTEPIASFDLEATELQVASTTQAHAFGTARLSLGAEGTTRPRQATYFAYLKRTNGAWAIDRLSVSAGEVLTTESASAPDAGSTPPEGVLAINNGDAIVPIATHVGDTYESIDHHSDHQKELLRTYDRYAVFPESAPAGLFSVDSIATRGRPVDFSFYVGVGSVTDTLEASDRGSRFALGRRGSLAFAVPPDSTVDHRTRMPTPDTTLTGAQRRAIAESVSAPLATEEADQLRDDGPPQTSLQTDLVQSILARLESSGNSTSQFEARPSDKIRERYGPRLAIDIASVDYRQDGSTEYVVVVERSPEAVIATKRVGQEVAWTTGEDSSRYVPAGAATPIWIEADSVLAAHGLNPDSTKGAFVSVAKQAAIFIGRITNDAWTPLDSIQRTTVNLDNTLQVLDVTGDGAPEFLLHGNAIGGVGYEVFSYQNGTLERSARFGWGS